MSRIGKRPVPLPNGVTANLDGRTVRVKGPKGELSLRLVDEVEASVGEDGITVYGWTGSMVHVFKNRELFLNYDDIVVPAIP